MTVASRGKSKPTYNSTIMEIVKVEVIQGHDLDNISKWGH